MKIEARRWVTEWNKLADQYIEFQNVAKLSISGRPLYQKCQSPACLEVGGRNPVVLKRCSHYCAKVGRLMSA